MKRPAKKPAGHKADCKCPFCKRARKSQRHPDAEPLHIPGVDLSVPKRRTNGSSKLDRLAQRAGFASAYEAAAKRWDTTAERVRRAGIGQLAEIELTKWLTRKIEERAARTRPSKPAAVQSQMRLFNPGGAKTLAQWLRAVSLVCTRKNHKRGWCTPSSEPEVLAAVELIRNTPAADRARFAQEQGAKRQRRRNPGLDEIETKAEQLYEAFHGKPAEQFIEIEEPVYHHRTMADLGELREIQIILADGKHLATIGFQGKGIRTAAAGVKKDGRGIYGTELHLVGGDQELDLASLKVSDAEATKPTVAVGHAHKITYFTSKHFHKFVPSEYEHELGEETGVKPLFCYDPRSRKMFLSGGEYEIRPEGITN
jgi:hypothetical protein